MSKHLTTKLQRNTHEVEVRTWDDVDHGVLYVATGAVTLTCHITPEQARQLSEQFAELAERLEKEAA